MAPRQCIIAMEPYKIRILREKFDGSLAKRQNRQYFPLLINYAIRYSEVFLFLKLASPVRRDNIFSGIYMLQQSCGGFHCETYPKLPSL